MTEETNHDYASKGVAGSGLGLGIAGTALGLLNGGLGMLNGGVSGGGKVNELMAENAMLKADAATDAKLVEVYTELRKQDKSQDAVIAAINTRLTAVETSAPLREQIVMGKIGEVATIAQTGIQANSTAIQNLATTVAGITKCVVPITAVCPQPMAQYNSWTAPTNGAVSA